MTDDRPAVTAQDLIAVRDALAKVDRPFPAPSIMYASGRAILALNSDATWADPEKHYTIVRNDDGSVVAHEHE